MKSVKEVVPWWIKISVKIVLARLPISNVVWKRLGIFEHGDINQPQRALEIFLERARTVDVLNREGGVPQFLRPEVQAI